MPHLACTAFATIDEFNAFLCECALTPTPTNDEITSALSEASDRLVTLSGGLFRGPCQETVYPWRNCNCGVTDGLGDYIFGNGRSDTIFSPERAIPLVAPLISITEVKVNGVNLTSDDYQVVEGHYLMRSDFTPWTPNSSDLSALRIIYTHGYRIETTERAACCEMAKLILDLGFNEAARILQGVSFATGGGVTVQRQPDSTDTDVQRVGDYPALNAFVAKWNPEGKRISSYAWSPELDDGWRLMSVGIPA